jgi:hypothetical protein
MGRKFNWESTASPPTNPKNTASAFAQWVYKESHYTNHGQLSNHQNKLQGRSAHLAIDNFFRMSWAERYLESDTLSDWIIEHTESDAREGKYFDASSLLINGNPMHCSPDLILRHKSKNQVLIIERKTTFVPVPKIPVNGWPNVQAQLWAYAWMDCVLDADEVILVGQLWHHQRNKTLIMCHSHPIWKRNDKEFHKKCVSWFNLFGGKFVNIKHNKKH